MEHETDELTLYELLETEEPELSSYSPFCLKVRRALQRDGRRFRSERGAHPAVFRRANPVGQVPVLRMNGEFVADSTRIIDRLEASSDQAMRSRLSDEQQAEAKLYEEFADSVLYGFVVAARWADPRNWPNTQRAYFRGAPRLVRSVIAPIARRRVLRDLRGRDIGRAGERACWQRFSTLLDQLDLRAPTRGFWVSQVITVADLALFAQLHSLKSELTPWQAGEVRARRRLNRYLVRVDRATAARELPSASSWPALNAA